ncbi:hypothetical protein [Streptomyces sp. 6-11-2]|uniref:hypothetical protein n=1 Tax=Streptomyces sp. 6-11-2 TaxID=2585753 RepID=UPI0011416988|nr:hypothetical protein [Streptomyces sp. 6-11-2]GED86373.1 hypothetical protein TNCT6_34580 [Streptomyces sp. 6-11-2]
MQTRGRRIRFAVVSAVVVLALTGFSQGHGHGRSRHSGGGGGGCSNSHQDHDSSTSSGSYGGSSSGSYGDSDDDGGNSGTGGTYNRRPGYRSTPTSPSGTGRSRGLRDATVRLISCATRKKPYATVEVANPNDSKADFQAWVTFYDTGGTQLLKNSSPVVAVPAKGKATTEVPLGEDFRSSADHCETDPTASPRN